MDLLFVLAAACTAFFALAYWLERTGRLGDSPCDCSECRRARRDPFRPW